MFNKKSNRVASLNLRTLRKHAGLSLKTISTELNCSKGDYKLLENQYEGENFPSETISSLIAVFRKFDVSEIALGMIKSDIMPSKSLACGNFRPHSTSREVCDNCGEPKSKHRLACNDFVPHTTERDWCDNCGRPRSEH